MTSFGEDTIAWVVVGFCAVFGFWIVIVDWLANRKDRGKKSK